jgi:hypothetical protein
VCRSAGLEIITDVTASMVTVSLQCGVCVVQQQQCVLVVAAAAEQLVYVCMHATVCALHHAVSSFRTSFCTTNLSVSSIRQKLRFLVTYRIPVCFVANACECSTYALFAR